MKETQIIKLISEKITNASSYLGDDCAYLNDEDLLMSSDSLVEGVHFLSDIEPYFLGWKSLAINLSDIAASGGIPKYFTMALSLPKEKSEDPWISKFLDGINDCSKSFNCSLIGGDLTASEKIFISICITGSPVISKRIARRSDAKIGQKVITCGAFGESAAGLWAIKNKKKLEYKELMNAHLKPMPKLKEAFDLMEKSENSKIAMIDSSDGLLDCLERICEASSVAIEIDLNKLKISESLMSCAKEAFIDVFEWVLVGGEDYSLLATIDENMPIPEGWSHIGQIAASVQKKISMLLDGKPFDFSNFQTFQHF